MSENQESRPVSARLIEIAEGDVDQRLDNFLMRQLKTLPKSAIYKLLRTGQVRVNKGRRKPPYRLVAGDVVRIPPLREGDDAPQSKAAPAARRWQELLQRIVHEDSRMLVIDKPAGLAVHAGSGIEHGVIELLRAARPDAPFMELAHRLDRDTSGALIIMKERKALKLFQELLREDGIDKRYLTLLAGHWNDARTLRTRLRRNVEVGGERIVGVDEETGREARSHFHPLDHYGGRATMMEVRIFTGRTHQIRVQAAEHGAPVAGDDKYGDREANRKLRKLGLKRMFLHAHALRWTWPDTGEEVSISVPMAPELRAVVDRLEAGR